MKTKVKLGDVFQFVNEIHPEVSFPEEEYFILIKSKNPKKPKTIGLWTINPETMTDNSNWKFRRLFNQIEVNNPNNISTKEFKSICSSFEFIKLSENAKKVVKNIYKKGKRISPLSCFS